MTHRRLAGLSALAVLALGLLYAFALGTEAGRDIDAWVLPALPYAEGEPHRHTRLQDGFDAVANTILALALVAVLVASLRQRGRGAAVIAVASLLGANISARLLKPLLGSADPLGGEAGRALEASFPSGHATAAMSLALVAVVVAPPLWRARVQAAGLGLAVAIGAGLVVTASHFPSDVLGGYLLAAAWVGAVTAAVRPSGRLSRAA